MDQQVKILQFIAAPDDGYITVMALPSHEERQKALADHNQSKDPRDGVIELDFIELDRGSEEAFIAMCFEGDFSGESKGPFKQPRLLDFDSEFMTGLDGVLTWAYKIGLWGVPLEFDNETLNQAKYVFMMIYTYLPQAAKGLDVLLARLHKLGMNSSFTYPAK